jgi:hypothetical protein
VDVDEDSDLPRFGLVELDDLESGRRRILVMRPKLRRSWIAREEARRAELRRIALRYGRPPFVLRGSFDAASLSRHLSGR